jgi:HEPN domain-containing protein
MGRESYFGVSEQAKASRHRLDDARALFNSCRWRGALYLAGYAIECRLKTKLMRMFDCRHLQELEEELQRRGALAGRETVFTHQLEVLLQLTQARDRLRSERQVWPQFALANRWLPAWRYSADLSNKEDAEDFLSAVDSVLRWIDYNL